MVPTFTRCSYPFPLHPPVFRSEGVASRSEHFDYAIICKMNVLLLPLDVLLLSYFLIKYSHCLTDYRKSSADYFYWEQPRFPISLSTCCLQLWVLWTMSALIFHSLPFSKMKCCCMFDISLYEEYGLLCLCCWWCPLPSLNIKNLCQNFLEGCCAPPIYFLGQRILND